MAYTEEDKKIIKEINDALEKGKKLTDEQRQAMQKIADIHKETLDVLERKNIQLQEANAKGDSRGLQLERERQLQANNLEINENRLKAARDALILGEKTEEQIKKELNLNEANLETLNEMVNSIAAREAADKRINDSLKQRSTLQASIEEKMIDTVRIMERGVGYELLRNKAMLIGDNLLEKGLKTLKSAVTDLIFEYDKVTKGFERQFQLGPAYTSLIKTQYTALNEYGVTLSEAAEATGALVEGVTDFTMASKSQQAALVETTALAQEFGISFSDQVGAIQASIKFFGSSMDSAEETTRDLISTAKALGREPAKLTAQFTAMSGQLAKFGDEGMSTFKELARLSKITGLEMEKLLNITNKFDTFEGAAQQAGQLNAALGGNFVNAMDLMMETDPAGRFEQIRGALDAAGLEFDNMSYYQRKFFTESLGLGDVGDLAMLMSGNINDLAGSTNQSAEELIAMKEKSQEVMNVTEAFRAIIADNTEAFIAFAEAMSDGVRFIQEHAGAIINIAKLYGAFRLGMTAFNTVQKIRNGLQKKTVGSIEEEISKLSEIIDKKLQDTSATEQQAEAEKKRAEEQEKSNEKMSESGSIMDSTAVKAIAFGAGIGLAALGLAQLVEAFGNLDDTPWQNIAIGMAGITAAIFAFGKAAEGLADPKAAAGIAAIGAASYGLGALVGAFRKDRTDYQAMTGTFNALSGVATPDFEAAQITFRAIRDSINDIDSDKLEELADVSAKLPAVVATAAANARTPTTAAAGGGTGNIGNLTVNVDIGNTPFAKKVMEIVKEADGVRLREAINNR